jgi:hypothetical protein
LIVASGEGLASAFEEESDAEAHEGAEWAEKETGDENPLDLCAQGRFGPGRDAFGFRDHAGGDEHPRFFAGDVWGENNEEHVNLGQDESDDGARFNEVHATHGISLRLEGKFEQRTKGHSEDGCATAKVESFP